MSDPKFYFMHITVSEGGGIPFDEVLAAVFPAGEPKVGERFELLCTERGDEPGKMFARFALVPSVEKERP